MFGSNNMVSVKYITYAYPVCVLVMSWHAWVLNNDKSQLAFAAQPVKVS